MQVEVLHLGVIRSDAGIQAGAELRVHVLQHPGTGHQRAEQEIPGRRIPRDGEIHIDRAVRIQAGLMLVQDKAVAGLRAEIVDGVEHVFRIQPVHGRLGMHNRHGWGPFLVRSVPVQKADYIIAAFRAVVKILATYSK